VRPEQFRAGLLREWRRRCGTSCLPAELRAVAHALIDGAYEAVKQTISGSEEHRGQLSDARHALLVAIYDGTPPGEPAVLGPSA
jgi:hypothetical protein